MALQTAVRLDDAQSDGLEVEVVERRDTLGAWAVEAINTPGDGEVYIAVFTGPMAKERAEEYADLKYGLR